MPIVVASSFADPADVIAYKNVKDRGGTEEQALAAGDSGIGCWGDATTSEDHHMCALPPEDWQAKWGAGGAARGRLVSVTYQGTTVMGELRDTMPHRDKIRNGAGIDLNPGFAKAFGVQQPFMLQNVEWNWA